MRDLVLIENAMEEKKSIFALIVNAIQDDGTLPAGFSLPANDDGGIAWAPGARDGVMYCHSQPQEPTADQLSLMADAVWAASIEDLPKADLLFSQLGASVPFASLISTFQHYILDNKDTINNGAIFNSAMKLAVGSKNVDSIKFSLAMMELFNTDLDEDIKEVVRTLALSDEFTIYCMYIMKGCWTDGNEEIFDAAKKVRGWGRIFAIDLLDPDTDEIREWLLTEGIHNDVLAAYSAKLCWEGSQAAKRLEGRLTQREFEGIRDIIAGLLDEGPCEGISGVEGIDSSVRTFLSRAREFRLGPEDYSVINDLKAYYSEKGKPGEFIVRLCEEIIKEM